MLRKDTNILKFNRAFSSVCCGVLSAGKLSGKMCGLSDRTAFLVIQAADGAGVEAGGAAGRSYLWAPEDRAGRSFITHPTLGTRCPGLLAGARSPFPPFHYMLPSLSHIMTRVESCVCMAHWTKQEQTEGHPDRAW